MKRGLAVILISLGIFFGTSCNKENLFGKVKIDYGEPKTVFSRNTPTGHSVYYMKNSFDTVYLWKFKQKPFNYGFQDFNGDGLEDFRYTKIEKGDFKSYWAENKGGFFGEAEDF